MLRACFLLPVVTPLLCALAAGQVQPAASDIGGAWEGKLDAGGVSLRIVFHITKSADGKYTATMDSPDQGATGLPVTSVEIDGRKMTLKAVQIGGLYEGEANEAFSELKGTWKQGGAAFPLNLKRQEKPIEIRRPQVPTKPYPYDEEEVSYENKAGGVTLGGTLTLPREGRPAAAVILISGSGPQDRDESLLGHRPFLVLADHLTRQGIAVLRVDDRGVGKSTGNTMNSTSEDFAGDVLAGVEFLKTRREINAKKIGLIGHSEGGIVGPLAAAKSPEIAFVVMLAGPGLPGEEILYSQGEAIVRAAGGDDATVARQRRIQLLIFSAIKSEKDPKAAAAKARELLMDEINKLSDAEKAALGDPAATVDAQIAAANSPWFRWFLTHDPRPTLAKLKCPVLAVIGEKDLQVPSKANLAEIEKALKSAGNKDFTVKELAGLNHLFQTATTGALSEYSMIEETFAPSALKLISDWIRERTK